jgi:hypothetical protein
MQSPTETRCRVLSTRIEPTAVSRLRSYAAATGQSQSTAAHQLLVMALDQVTG